jgi:tetratricopeptide (TPR) repeat protein
MKTATRINDLKTIEQDLLHRLQRNGFKRLSLQLNCQLIDETLMVIVEHPANVSLKTEPTLTALQEALIELQPPKAKQVGLCLKVASAEQPYAFHSFMMEPLDSSQLIYLSHPEILYPNASDSPEKITEISPNVLEDSWQVSPETCEQHPLDETTVIQGESEPNLQNKNLTRSDSELEDFSLNPFDVHDLEKVSEAKPTSQSSWKLVLAASAGVASVLILSGFYLLSRPCVLGECIAIPLAQELNKDVDKVMKRAKDSEDPMESQKKLKEAIALLDSVPFWSLKYGEAQKLLAEYRVKNVHLDLLSAALTNGTLAMQKGAKAPHSSQTWREAKTLWEKAINPLETISKESIFYPFAQEKIKQYQNSLADVVRSLNAEERAEIKLQEAEQIAKLAEARESVAQFPDSWAKIEESWQQALDKLTSISTGTTAFEQARSNLIKYESKLAQAQDRKVIEKVGEDAYTKAATAASQAKILEQRKRYTQAKDYWLEAVAYIEKVPKTSSFYNKAKPLISSYKESLSKVEEQADLEKRLDQARQDLNKTCNGSLKVCDYTISEQLITVQITALYVQKLQQTVQSLGSQKNKEAQYAINNHIQTLQVALEAISDNAKVKLHVYDPNGNRIGTRIPKSR